MKIKTQLVPVLTQLLARTSLGVLAAMGVISYLMPQPSLAQVGVTNDPGKPSDQFQNQTDVDPMSGRNSGGFNPLDLIHRAQLGGLRDPNDFNAEQNQNLNDAAADYKRQQLLRLGNPKPTQNQQQPNSQPKP